MDKQFEKSLNFYIQEEDCIIYPIFNQKKIYDQELNYHLKIIFVKPFEEQIRKVIKKLEPSLEKLQEKYLENFTEELILFLLLTFSIYAVLMILSIINQGL